MNTLSLHIQTSLKIPVNGQCKTGLRHMAFQSREVINTGMTVLSTEVNILKPLLIPPTAILQTLSSISVALHHVSSLKSS